MAYDILLDPPSYFQPRDIVDLPFVHQEIPELKKNEIKGNVAAWIEYLRLTRGETVTPHTVFHVRQGDGEDTVAWVRRTGTTQIGGEVEELTIHSLFAAMPWKLMTG